MGWVATRGQNVGPKVVESGLVVHEAMLNRQKPQNVGGRSKMRERHTPSPKSSLLLHDHIPRNTILSIPNASVERRSLRVGWCGKCSLDLERIYRYNYMERYGIGSILTRRRHRKFLVTNHRISRWSTPFIDPAKSSSFLELKYNLFFSKAEVVLLGAQLFKLFENVKHLRFYLIHGVRGI